MASGMSESVADLAQGHEVEARRQAQRRFED
jgi:hypothetical protein